MYLAYSQHMLYQMKHELTKGNALFETNRKNEANKTHSNQIEIIPFSSVYFSVFNLFSVIFLLAQITQKTHFFQSISLACCFWIRLLFSWWKIDSFFDAVTNSVESLMMLYAMSLLCQSANFSLRWKYENIGVSALGHSTRVYSHFPFNKRKTWRNVVFCCDCACSTGKRVFFLENQRESVLGEWKTVAFGVTTSNDNIQTACMQRIHWTRARKQRTEQATDRHFNFVNIR